MKINNIQNKNQEYKTPTFGALNLSPPQGGLWNMILRPERTEEALL